ncbi:MAG: hypothetical protein K6A33_10875 [Clostridiales bacterium]|nr:hypothetical protein [Clostridiales bacterium]
MKKILAILSAVILVVCAATAVHAGENARVYVTISDENGKLAVAQEEIVVHDADEDGAITVNDAMIVAHDEFYDGGAAAGYETATSEYGISMNKLWGTENGGSYGYYVNGTAAWSLADTISDGDFIDAFVYTDLTAWSDMYTCFEPRFVTSGTAELTLTGAGFDENWNPVSVPVAGAEITLNGAKTGVFTDEAGKATVPVDTNAGRIVISAVSESQTIVPPVAIVEGEGTAPQTGDLSVVIAAAAVLSLCAAALVKKHSDQR